MSKCHNCGFEAPAHAIGCTELARKESRKFRAEKDARYTITFQPKRYRIKEQNNVATATRYWVIIDYENDVEVGFCVTENDAKTVVLALDYMHAVVIGDVSVQRGLTRALEKIRN